MKKIILTDFAVGIITGIIISILAFTAITVKYFLEQEKKEIIENAKRQQAILELQEDFSNLDYLELLDTVPGVRGAADTATVEFERKRDEILERFRNRIID